MNPGAALAGSKVFDKSWKWIAMCCLAILVIRWIAMASLGLMPQDAYYDFYAEHLALSYYDHPPMIAYLLRTFTTVFGKRVFVIKLADSAVTIFTIAAFYQLAKRFLSKHKAATATLLLVSTFMVSILSLISTPDVPLMACWTITLIFLYEAIFNNRKLYWIWAGIMTGLSFDSKYTALFLLIGVTGFLIISKSHRKLLVSPWFYAYLLCFAVMILPVVIWNVQNGFASFRFQSEGRVKEGVEVDPTGLLGVIGHQSAILLPILFFSFVYFLFRLCKKFGFRFGRIPSKQLFLLCFFIPLFFGFLGIASFYWVKINWIMPAYISGILWLAPYWNKKWLRYQLVFSAVLHVALIVEVLFYIVPIRSDDTWFGWQDFSDQVSEVRKAYPNAFIFSSDDYKTSAELNFFLSEMIYAKNVVGERALQFDFIGTDLRTLNGRDALFINSDPRFTDLKNDSTVPSFFHDYFDRFIPLQPILVSKNGKPERKFSLILCRNYHYIGLKPAAGRSGNNKRKNQQFQPDQPPGLIFMNRTGKIFRAGGWNIIFVSE